MKVALVNNTVPFLRGGAEILVDSLAERLAMAGHVAEVVRLPFSWDPPERIADSMLAASLTKIAEVDRVIAFKFPAYLVPHDNKVVWLLHQFRQYYDLWDETVPATPMVSEIRGLVHRADVECFSGATRMFANSEVTVSRLRRFNGVDAEVLYPPLPNPGLFRSSGLGDYVFAGGRINGFKRQILAVQAMAHTRSNVRLVVAGAPETKADLDELNRARDAALHPDRITIIPEFIDEGVKAELVNGALACVYSPIDEDSYGYVTLEAAQAGKALITTSDSGGILNLVIDGQSGVVCEPDQVDLARAFDALAGSPSTARQLGLGAHDRMLELGISWERVLNRLLT